MLIELHDNEEPNTLVARIKGFDYDFQVEMFVAEEVPAHIADYRATEARRPYEIVKAVLMDDMGERARWEVKEGKIVLVSKEARFQGEWVLGHGVSAEYKAP